MYGKELGTGPDTEFSAAECLSPEGGTCWQAGHPLEFHEWLGDMGGLPGTFHNLCSELLAGQPASLECAAGLCGHHGNHQMLMSPYTRHGKLASKGCFELLRGSLLAMA